MQMLDYFIFGKKKKKNKMKKVKGKVKDKKKKQIVKCMVIFHL
jgi:hypothetical protein